MPNTLTGLIPDLYEALDVVSRELVGLVPAVTRDSGVERAAVNQTVRSHVAPASTASNITPGVTAPDSGDQTIGNVTISITKARAVPVRWNGEEQRGINSGSGYRAVLRDQFSQAFRTLANEMETDLAALHVSASRAHGTSGTTPFGTAGNYTDASNALKILLDNGAPNSDLHLVINTAAGANLRGLQGGKANEAGTAAILRQGVLLDIHGFAIRESAQIVTFTAGSVTGTVTATGAVDATAVSITTAVGASTAIKAGDVVTFAGDANKYIAAADLTLGASVSGTLTIAAPGLRRAASSAGVSVAASFAANMAFRRSAIVLANRLPALPEEGDMADDRMTMVDPISGLPFEVSLYRQYRQIRYEVAAAWGVKVIKPEHLAVLQG